MDPKLANFENPALRGMHPSPLDQLTLRLSPASSRHSNSPHISLEAKDQKIHSTIDQSNSEQSEDEDIDVVKSAFQPIKTINLVQEVQHPDSTVQDVKEPIRCELKAPSSRKSLSVSPKSPATKIHTGSAQKAVWRPY